MKKRFYFLKKGRDYLDYLDYLDLPTTGAFLETHKTLSKSTYDFAILPRVRVVGEGAGRSLYVSMNVFTGMKYGLEFLCLFFLLICSHPKWQMTCRRESMR